MHNLLIKETAMTDQSIDRNQELAGKIALVTGSARNIGRAIALELAKGGANLTINAVNDRGAADAVADEVRALGVKAIVSMADITKMEDCQRIVSETIEAFGGLDILINNAAVRTKVDFLDLTWEDWIKSRDVALDGAIRMAMCAAPEIVKRGGGSIIGIGGLMATIGSPGGAHKSATKDGMSGFTRGLAVDLGKHNINSNVVVVGSIDTDRESGSGEKKTSKKPDIPMGNLGQPEDIAYMVRHLSGPFARYVSGQTIHVNGASYRPHSA
jgi:3-oxoacyl-[acyl-carrier protein] reductase